MSDKRKLVICNKAYSKGCCMVDSCSLRRPHALCRFCDSNTPCTDGPVGPCRCVPYIPRDWPGDRK